LHPSTWKYLINPAKPSWGEPYVDLVNRMLRALWFARDNANGKSAICVSHQLPIWILRRFIEGKSFIHDPRRRQCTLASVTAIELDITGAISDISYQEPAKELLPRK
jgi:broad specificity phosphatase PhoE